MKCIEIRELDLICYNNELSAKDWIMPGAILVYTLLLSLFALLTLFSLSYRNQ